MRAKLQRGRASDGFAIFVMTFAIFVGTAVGACPVEEQPLTNA